MLWIAHRKVLPKLNGTNARMKLGSTLRERSVPVCGLEQHIYLFSRSCKDPKAALASIKRDKGEAKKKARAQWFSYLDQLF